ncbi:hypothetical protein EZV62_022130 [Acer yangbiense]|uniref:WAT1-related protein n=1 Tax=Acer yangbiense TaxID=1000413 RepID=A0A5C7H7P3_9ROSI|nr:hypothetical protein EZV62_022130 [Acer yangbiense]
MGDNHDQLVVIASNYDENNNKNNSSKCMAVFEKLKPYVLMVFLQFGAAGMYIISMETLNHGMNQYVLIVYRNAIAALVLAPFALLIERPILDQGFSYLGMKYTSASYTSAIMNAVPSVTFVIALIFRLERLNIKKIHSQAKVIGTLVTFGGALLMSMYKGPVINLVGLSTSSHHESSSDSSDNHEHWVAGTLLILVGCVAWSCFYVVQSITLKKYPAELSLSSLICAAGTLQSAAVALAVEHHASAWAVGWDSRLFAPLYTGIVSSGITYYVQGIVMKTRGPVFVTAFNPLCMIIVAILGSIILAEKLHLGSIIGGMIIAVGLYSVVWGKSKDYSASSSKTKAADDTKQLPISSKSDDAT